MSASKASLEEVFLELTEGTLTESQDPGYETNHSEDETNDPGTGSSLDQMCIRDSLMAARAQK